MYVFKSTVFYTHETIELVVALLLFRFLKDLLL